VLLVRAAGRTALLLADIPRRIEDRIVAAGPLPVDIVLVAHHGSATASGEALRTATRVKEGGHAVVSAGYRNRWAFPKPAVRAGWLAEGRQVWVTAEEGALQFAVAPSGALRVASLRRLQPRWWRPAAPSLSP
jgi:competence protein ComEC